jgi:hypothetical protein
MLTCGDAGRHHASITTFQEMTRRNVSICYDKVNLVIRQRDVTAQQHLALQVVGVSSHARLMQFD